MTLLLLLLLLASDGTQVFFLCLAWLPYSYSTHTTRQYSLRSALAVCDQSLRMARKRMRTSKRRMNRMAYAASVRCSAGIYFILLYSNVKYKCVCVWSAYTTSLDECVCVCVCSRCAAVSYLRLCHRYVRSLKARPNDHYYHKHISNSNPSESFKLQLASALSCIYIYIFVSMYVCSLRSLAVCCCCCCCLYFALCLFVPAAHVSSSYISFHFI